MASSLFPKDASLLTIPAGADSFSIPSPPTTSTATKVVLAPDFQAGPTGLSPYHPWSTTVLDGIFYLTNGFDQPQWWNGSSAFYNIGSVVPTEFSLADSSSGTTFALGTVVTYFLVAYNSQIGKETAPEGGLSGLSHTMVATKDIDITWSTIGAGEFDYVRIYRQLAASDTVKFITAVAMAAGTYTDGNADSVLEGNASYVKTYRETLPPKFDWIQGYEGRLFGGFYDSPTVNYAQAVRIDAENRTQDFPEGWILQPGEEDGTGGTTAMLPHYSAAYFFKRRACYELYGSIADGTNGIRRIGKDRGCLNDRCIVELDSMALVLDEKGLYWWSPSGEVVICGALTGTRESPLQPTWDRMNLAAYDTFFMLHDRKERIVRCFVALDFEPAPTHAVVFDYGENRFVGVDTLVHGTAAGELQDAAGGLHHMRGCDMGYLWEEEYAASQGVFAGDNTGTLTAGTRSLLTDSGAAFDTTTADGLPGAPYERYDTGGSVLDQNRVAAAAGTTIEPFYFSTDAPSVDDTVAVGVIPAVVRTPRVPLNSPDKKWVRNVTVEHDNGVSGNLKVESARDEQAFALSREFSLSSNIRTMCKVSDRGWTWSVQFSQRYANLGFAIRGVHIEYLTIPGQRK